MRIRRLRFVVGLLLLVVSAVPAYCQTAGAGSNTAKDIIDKAHHRLEPEKQIQARCYENEPGHLSRASETIH